MDSPESIHALQWSSDLCNKHKVAAPPTDFALWAGGSAEFDSGQAAMRLFGCWPQSGYKGNPNLDLGVVGVPSGRDVLFLLLFSTMMLPYPVTMIPIYVGFKTVGWVNTSWPLIVPAFFGGPFYILLLRHFFLTLPPEVEDAARVDGAGTLRILWRVIMPISPSAAATVAVFSFQFAWNDFLCPLIYLHDQSKHTISLGLSFFRSSYDIRSSYLMAASLVTMLPVIIVFLLAQRMFIEGIALTGVTR